MLGAVTVFGEMHEKGRKVTWQQESGGGENCLTGRT